MNIWIDSNLHSDRDDPNFHYIYIYIYIYLKE